MKKIILAFTLVCFAPLAVMAASSGGSDSCGLGWQITKKKSFFGTTTRGTTNAFVPPTYGMTTGTMGCDRHSIAKNDMEALEYVASNHESLSLEAAEGRGEYIDGLARSFGCSDNVTAQFGKTLQGNYSEIFSTKADTPVDLYRRVKDAVKGDTALSASCKSLS